MINISNNTVKFTIFDQFPELVCTMSTRVLNNLNLSKLGIQNAKHFLDVLEIPLNRFIGMKQLHNDRVKEVDKSIGGQLTEGVDGLISKENNLYIGVNIADCVPIFFYDPDKKFIGVAHAGWKGTLGKITQKMIREFIKRGIDISTVFAAIGPHIGGCCYNVNSDRARLFLDSFKQDAQIAFENDGEWFVDLGKANKKLLMESGVLKDHIDASITCTSCQNDLFFSFRKDSKETFGEMLGIIGMRQDL